VGHGLGIHDLNTAVRVSLNKIHLFHCTAEYLHKLQTLQSPRLL